MHRSTRETAADRSSTARAASSGSTPSSIRSRAAAREWPSPPPATSCAPSAIRSAVRRVSLEVLRGAERLASVVTIAERARHPERFADRVSPDRNAVARLGVLALDLDDAVAQLLPPLRARAGVVVATAGGRAEPDPLLAGDVIYSVNQEPVSGVERLREVLAQLKAGSPVVLQVERGGELRFLVIEPE